MTNPSGSVTVNGISDAELAEILEIKSRNPGANFNFNPQQIQSHNAPNGVPFYTNAIFTWNGQAGLVIVQEILNMLLKGETKAQKAQ